MPVGGIGLALLAVGTGLVIALPTARLQAEGAIANGWTVEVSQGRPAATRIRLAANEDRARFSVDLSRAVPVQASTLTDPDRVIIDLPEIDFRVPAAAGQKGQGIVKAFRFGQFGARQSRIVIDTDGPVRIESAAVSGQQGRGPELVVALVRADPSTLPEPAPAARAPAMRPSDFDDAALRPGPGKSRPVIVIDPGHGGLDPGAVGPDGLVEKNVVLSVSRHLRDALAKTGRYTVVMTRASDIYVSLNQRLKISHRNQADLFLSIHADAVAEDSLAQAVRGGSVYMLSEQASDEQARRLAEKENAADVLAGLESTPWENQSEVRSILVDLLRRETSDFSANFRNLLTGELRKHVILAKDPQRAAAFKVLKQTHSPSVLIELGYMSNPEDQKLLRSVDWQKRVASAIATAVEAFFANRAVGAVTPQ